MLLNPTSSKNYETWFHGWGGGLSVTRNTEPQNGGLGGGKHGAKFPKVQASRRQDSATAEKRQQDASEDAETHSDEKPLEAKIGRLRAALASTQIKLNEAGREKAVAVAARDAKESAEADERIKLAGAQKQVAVLTATLTATTRKAADTAQLLTSERASGETVQVALTAALANQERTGREKAAVDTALRDAESAAAALRARLVVSTDEQAKVNRESALALMSEQANRGVLQAALASAQARAERADREKAVAVTAVHAGEGVVADQRTRLEDTQKRLSATTAALMVAKSEAARASVDAKRLVSERVDSGALQASLVSARAQTEQAGRDKEAAGIALHASERAEADTKAKLAAVTDELTAMKRTAAQATKTAESRASADYVSHQADIASARAEAEQVGRGKEAAASALHVSEGALADTKAKLVAVTGELAVAKREAGQATTSSAPLAVEPSGNGALQAAVVAARARADRADREKAISIASLRASEAVAAGHQMQLEAMQKQVATLAAQYAGAKRDAEQATKATQRLADERVEGSTLRAALASARANMDQAAREKTAALAALHAAESVDADRDGKLQAALKRAATLAAALESTKREAELAKESARRIADERSQGGALRAALAAARAEADRAGREKAVAIATLQASKSTEADRQAELEEARIRATAVGSELAAAKRAAQATEKLGEPVDATQEKAPKSSDHVAVGTNRLPDGVVARVRLHYSMTSEASRTQAAMVKSQLSDLGLDVAVASELQKDGSKTAITYYYKQDERAAISIAEKIRAPDPVRTRIPTTQLPRPGTIEISLGNQTSRRSEASP